MAARWVRSDISEVEVKRDEYSIFSMARRQEIGIGRAGQALRVRSLDIVPKIAQRRLNPFVAGSRQA